MEEKIRIKIDTGHVSDNDISYFHRWVARPFLRLFCFIWMVFCVCFPFGIIVIFIWLPVLIFAGYEKAEKACDWSQQISKRMMCGCDDYLLL